MIDRHRHEEGALLERYERIVEGSAAAGVSYLANLILQDERLHHRLLADIAHAIAWGGITNARPAVPRVVEGAADDALVAQTKLLLASEKKDRTDLRRLRRRLRSYNGTMWPLLVDIMLQDTSKHIRILRFIVKHRPG